MMMKIKKQIYLLFLCLLLSGCHLLTPANSEINKYVLNQVPVYFSANSVNANSLLILFPDSNDIYNTRGIAYIREPYLVEYYTKNEWNATPAQMFYPLMILAFENRCYFNNILMQPYMGNQTLTLKTQIIEFLQDFTQEPALFTFTLQAQLEDHSTKKVSTTLITVEEPITIAPPYGGIVAANCATEKMLKQLVAFTTKQQ